eukprot:5984075-Prymnesium_polylepis.1
MPTSQLIFLCRPLLSVCAIARTHSPIQSVSDPHIQQRRRPASEAQGDAAENGGSQRVPGRGGALDRRRVRAADQHGALVRQGAPAGAPRSGTGARMGGRAADGGGRPAADVAGVGARPAAEVEAGVLPQVVKYLRQPHDAAGEGHREDMARATRPSAGAGTRGGATHARAAGA